MREHTFLNSEELFELTGRRIKSKQIEALRAMGLPFFINAVGKPVVSRAVINGGIPQEPETKWVPRVTRNMSHGTKA